MKKILFVLLAMVASPSLAVTHPSLIVSSSSYAAMVTSSTIHPWSDILSEATNYIDGTHFIGIGGPVTLGTYGFANGSPLPGRQDRMNQMIDLQGANQLRYVLNTNNSGSITARTAMIGMLDAIPGLYAEELAFDPSGTDYEWKSPFDGAIFQSILSLDVIWNDLSTVKQSSYTAMIDSYVAFDRSNASSWAMSGHGLRAAWSVFRGTDTNQIIVDTTVYHYDWVPLTDHQGTDLIYPGGPAYNSLIGNAADPIKSSEQAESMLNSGGGASIGPEYAWARIGGNSREKIAKWGFLDVARKTGVDLPLTANPLIGKFYEWLFAAYSNPFNYHTIFGDTSNSYPLGGSYWISAYSQYYVLSHGNLNAGLYSPLAQGWSYRQVISSTKTIKYPFNLIDYATVTGPISVSTPIVSYVIPKAGAAFWDDVQSTSALHGVLNNTHTTHDHLHGDQNALFLSGYGEILMSNVGYTGGASGSNGFPRYYLKDSCFANNDVLIGGQECVPTQQQYLSDPNIPNYGGEGIQESILAPYFDYAAGLSTSVYQVQTVVWDAGNQHFSASGAPTGSRGSHTRNFIFVHPADSVPGYWVAGDEVNTSTQGFANVLWHPYAANYTTTTLSTEYLWAISQIKASTTNLSLFYATPPTSITISSSPFAGGPDFVAQYHNVKYNVDASSNVRALTVIYPSDSSHTKATFTRLAPTGGATGALVSNGLVDDYVLTSSAAVTNTTGAGTYKGLAAFIRLVNSVRTSYFVRKGYSFDSDEATRTGFSSPVPISIYMRGSTGQMVSTGTAVTFYYPGITGVLLNGSNASGTLGSNSFTTTVSSGNVLVSLNTNSADTSTSSATVYVGGSIQFTSTNSVTWSLTSGSTGTIGGSGLYTAPASLSASNVSAGCPLLPNDHVYNTRIDALPVEANSSARIAHILSGATTYVRFEVSFPTNIVSSNTSTTSMTFLYTPNNDGAFPVLPFPYRGVENSALPSDYFAQDRHILAVSTNTCQFSDMYNFYPAGAATALGCPSCTSSSGIKYEAMSYALPGDNNNSSTDAAGLYIQPLALRYSELKSGIIKHALRFTMDNGDLYTGFVWPGTANATPGCTPLASCIQYGARFRLKSSFNISGFSPTSQTILTALKNYGMFISDGGTAMHIQTMGDVVSDTTTYASIFSELGTTTTLTQFQFEQVDESSLMVSTASGKVNLSNPYVVPANFAQVVATNISNGATASTRIAIQPVTVGTYNPAFPANSGVLSVMAGTPQFQIPYWVKGTTTTTVTCSMSPSTGSLTSDCLYTAPTTKTLMSSITITITPTADPTQAITFPLVIFPSDGIRINVGGQSIYNVSPVIPYDASGNYGPDVYGKYWWSDPVGNIPPWYSRADVGYPQASWPATSDIGLFYTRRGSNNDGAFSAMVPDGDYTLSMGFAFDNNNHPSDYYMSIDSQGNTLFGPATLATVVAGDAQYTPGTISYPVTVAGNKFYFALRMITQGKFTDINKWSLIPITVPSSISNKLTGSLSLKGGVRIK